MGERRGTKALELWCRRMTEGYPGVKIDNMTTSWRDGLAFCAIIHHFRPDLIEFEKLNKGDVYYNNELAFTTAEKYLGIPALLDADDMAAYQVPDRLSILTYLSQFYQAFAAQDAHNRLKRSSSATAEKSQINKTPGPPPKMAHVVGVPKRDPCQRCQLPVFLAERLTVGKKIYHRTCLKCARCGSQLSPGSFYETEVDDEYCCETCPDEEDSMAETQPVPVGGVPAKSPAQPGSETAGAGENVKGVRSSIADRLAFFEKSKTEAVDGGASSVSAASVTASVSGHKLLEKSVTDEEKSKSLKRMEKAQTPYKMNAALCSFLNETIEDGGAEMASAADSEPSSTTEDAKTDTAVSTTEGESDDDGDAEMEEQQAPPELPASLPPTPSTRFTSTAQLQMTLSPEAPVERDREQNLTAVTTLKTQERKKTEIQLNLSTKTTEDDNALNNNVQHAHNSGAVDGIAAEKAPQGASGGGERQIDLELSEDCVTKDNAAVSATTAAYATTTTTATTVVATTATKLAIAAAPAGTAPAAHANEIAKIQTALSQLENETSTDDNHQPEDVAEELAVELRKQPLALVESPHGEEQQAGEGGEQQENVIRVEEVGDVETTERLSVVRARLQQFEVIANNHNHSIDTNQDNENARLMSPQEQQDKPINNNHNNSSLGDEPTDASTTVSVDEKLITPSAPDAPYVVSPVLARRLGGDMKPEVMEVSNVASAAAAVENVTDVAEPEAVKTVPLNMETQDNTTEDPKPTVVEAAVDEAAAGPVDRTLDVEQQESNGSALEAAESQQTGVDVKVETLDTLETPETQEMLERVFDNVVAVRTDEKPEDIEKLALNTPSKQPVEEYPEDLNPFQSDDDEEPSANKENALPTQTVVLGAEPVTPVKPAERSNPFDSSDDEIELNKSSTTLVVLPSAANSTTTITPVSHSKIPPPRPPPPRISRNPFGDDDDAEDMDFSRRSSLNSSLTRKTPVPTPRTNLSQNPTPEPTPRLSTKTPQGILQNSSDYYGSANSLSSSTPHSLQRNAEVRGSNNSLASSAGGTIRMRKMRKAPAPPPPVKELFPSTETISSSRASTPSSSTVGTPKSGRKKRHAPAPPKPARLDPTLVPPQIVVEQDSSTGTPPKNSLSYPLQSESDSKLSDEEKALLEGKLLPHDGNASTLRAEEELTASESRRNSRRVIPVDASLMEEFYKDRRGSRNPQEQMEVEVSKCDDHKQQQQEQYNFGGDAEENVVYRRVLIPPVINTPTHEHNPLLDELSAAHGRQLEKLKDNKEAKNRNRQSQISAASSGTDDCDPTTLYNKSSHGKWKRRKGPAPALPVPPRKVLLMLPLQEIRHELDIIEVQQQGLEKQGVVLEKMIRDRCENERGEPLTTASKAEEVDAVGDAVKSAPSTESVQNTKEVEDLILQLFELVNEKNELFRRQAELMYLRRQHRLEQEQADLEYEIRVLMAQPERNKTDSDKAREEALIARLVEVVQLRNEVIECLEMDRLREAEEDLSIKQRLELHTAKREDCDDEKKTTAKLSKKEKRKQKESKKLSKNKKIDADKDADETEFDADKQKTKKKKKKFLF